MLPGFIGGGVARDSLASFPALLLTWGVSPDVVAESSRIYVFDRLPHHLAPLTLPTAEVTRRLTGMRCCWRCSLACRFCSGDCELRNDADRESRSTSSSASIARFAASNCSRWVQRCLAAIGFAIELSLASQPELAAKLLRYYWFRLTRFRGRDGGRAAAHGVDRDRLRTARTVGEASVARGNRVRAAWFPVTACRDRLAEPEFALRCQSLRFPAWIEVCDWVKANTPADALFLTPRLNLSFKWRTGRPEVVNRKDIPQDAAGIVAWHDRLKDIYTTQFGGIDQNVDSVGPLGDDRVRELAKKYHANYVLSDRGQLLSLPIAFENEEYVVYRIEDRALATDADVAGAREGGAPTEGSAAVTRDFACRRSLTYGRHAGPAPYTARAAAVCCCCFGAVADGTCR